MSHPLSRELCRPKSGQYFAIGKHKYVLAGKIGDGAVGLVRKARRLSNDQFRAIKFLAPDPNYIEEDVFDDVANRFQREGNRGTKLDHPHLITIHSYCENDNGSYFEDERPINPFIIMELIQGKTLESYIRRQPEKDSPGFSISQEKLIIAIQIVSALKYLRDRKLIHRDVKPANIFLSRLSRDNDSYPLVKLGDFGVMKWGDFHASVATGTLTVTHQSGLGTLKYMSPEQATSPKKITVRSDIWSLGITLFELFTGNILPTPVHVYEISFKRLEKGNAASRFLSLGYNLYPNDYEIAEMLLNMFLRGAKGRPNISNVLGLLKWEYENRYGTKWRSEFERNSNVGRPRQNPIY